MRRKHHAYLQPYKLVMCATRTLCNSHYATAVRGSGRDWSLAEKQSQTSPFFFPIGVKIYGWPLQGGNMGFAAYLVFRLCYTPHLGYF